MRLSARDMDHAADYLWGLLMEGHSDSEARDALGLDLDTYKNVKLRCLDRKAQELRKTPIEHTYAQYILDQCQNIRELTDAIAKYKKDDKTSNALIGAIRLRADLYDRVMTKGQECGIIHKAADKKQVVAGVVVTDLTSDGIRTAIQNELAQINELMSSHGETSFMDVKAGALHHGPALPAATHAVDDDEAGSKSGPKEIPERAALAKKKTKKRRKKSVKKQRV